MKTKETTWFGFATSYEAAVAAIIHLFGPEYLFNHDGRRAWPWWDMVAQMDEESIEYVVEHGDCSRCLVDCEFRMRDGSYDHKRQVQCRNERPQLLECDFVLWRIDGSAVRLHPDWFTHKIPILVVEGEGGP